MRIHEIIVENNQLDELDLSGIGKRIGKAAGAVGQVVGGVQGAWQGAKAAYGQNRDRVASVAQRNVQRGGGYRTPGYTRPTPQSTTPATNVPPTPQSTTAPTTTPATNVPPTPQSTTAPSQRVPVVQARTDVKKAIDNIQKVRARDRAEVVQFAQQKLAAVREEADFHSNFLGKMI